MKKSTLVISIVAVAVVGMLPAAGTGVIALDDVKQHQHVTSQATQLKSVKAKLASTKSDLADAKSSYEDCFDAAEDYSSGYEDFLDQMKTWTALYPYYEVQLTQAKGEVDDGNSTNCTEGVTP